MTKKNNFISLIVLACFFLFGSCLTVSTVEIEVIKPAKITIPSNIKSWLVINNSLLYHENIFLNDVRKGLFSLDTTTTQYITQSVNDYLNQSPRFDTSILIKDMYFRHEKDLMQPIELNAVEKICANNKSDALLSLEAFGINDTITRVKYFDGFTYSSYPALKVVVNSMWRIYSANEKKILEKTIQRDTLYFDAISSKNEYYELLTQADFVDYMAAKITDEMASKIADRIAPYWQPVQRDFFIYDNNKMKMAAKYAYNDNWIAAATIWKTLVDDENKRIAGAACHNMALACEVEGKLDVAMEWLEESQEKYYNYITSDYSKILSARIQETNILNEQFGVQ